MQIRWFNDNICKEDRAMALQLIQKTLQGIKTVEHYLNHELFINYTIDGQDH